MIYILVLLAFAGLLWPTIRFIAILFVCMVIAGAVLSYSEESKTLTYEQLVNYPTDCAKADIQLKELKSIQETKRFNPNPDNLEGQDYAYNSRLKATIWWYAYTCDKS